jgi:hypothetical protein
MQFFRLSVSLAFALESDNEEPVAIGVLNSLFFQNRLHLFVWEEAEKKFKFFPMYVTCIQKCYISFRFTVSPLLLTV